jgi:hypothetical protein
MTRFWLSDESNGSTEIFTVVSTFFIEGRGLHPSTPDGVVSDCRFASLEIRQPFDERVGYGNGMVLTPQIAGRSH